MNRRLFLITWQWKIRQRFVNFSFEFSCFLFFRLFFFGNVFQAFSARGKAEKREDGFYLHQLFGEWRACQLASCNSHISNVFLLSFFFFRELLGCKLFIFWMMARITVNLSGRQHGLLLKHETIADTTQTVPHPPPPTPKKIEATGHSGWRSGRATYRITQ